jgi:hypothetical protein
LFQASYLHFCHPWQSSRECRYCRSIKPAPVTRRLKSTSCWLNPLFLSTLSLNKGRLKFIHYCSTQLSFPCRRESLLNNTRFRIRKTLSGTTSYGFLILNPLKNRLKYISNNRKKRALSEIFFYTVKMVELHSGCYC